MKRAIFSVITVLFAAAVAAGEHSARAAAEPEHPVSQSPRTIALDVIIGKIQGSITAEQAAQMSGPSEKVAAFVQELESSGRIRVSDRIRLATLENQKTLVQAGKTVPVATGRTFSPGRGGPQTSYQQQNVGTLISVTARADGDAVMAELEIEKSQLEQRTGDPATDEPFVLAATETMQSRTNVRIGNGETLLVSTDASQQFVLVSARFVDGPPRRKSEEPPGAGKAAAQPASPPRVQTARRLQYSPLFGRSLIVVVPVSRDAVLAYSVESGRWNRQAITPVDNAPIVPIVGGNVAAVAAGNRVLAFSGLKGDWDWITVSDASKAVPVVEGDAVTLQDGSSFYVFSAKSGAWTGIDLQTGKLIGSPSPTETEEVDVYEDVIQEPGGHCQHDPNGQFGK